MTILEVVFTMYMLRTDKITDEEDNEYEVYGLDAAEGDVSLSFPDIFETF